MSLLALFKVLLGKWRRSGKGVGNILNRAKLKSNSIEKLCQTPTLFPKSYII
ncbi:hypothetical protein J2Z37_002362 [Ammoniphilus resinae]|uniref:Uncharacterized protein n=1 Tax=Ammoniphilus resinae TaxID=861532 RepID=A0ABS4GQ40_9BACL|nr:hypothetical protein [Ammoniphilus resinae]